MCYPHVLNTSTPTQRVLKYQTDYNVVSDLVSIITQLMGNDKFRSTVLWITDLRTLDFFGGAQAPPMLIG